MTRREDWPLRLNDVIEAARGRPFDWVTHNCATFCAAGVAAMTGEDLAPAFAGLHASAPDAARASTRLADEVTARLGAPVAPAWARRGDVVLVQNDGRVLLGLCVGVQVASVGENGLAFVSIKEGVCAWHI